jgi:hypothetical protein
MSSRRERLLEAPGALMLAIFSVKRGDGDYRTAEPRRGLKMLWCFLLLAIATFIVGLSSMQG